MRHIRLVGLLLVAALTAGIVRDARAQNVVISGTVMSEDGRPVYPATVDLVQLNIGVPTSAQGRYTLTVPSSRVAGQVATLRVRAFGHRPGSRQIKLSAGEQTVDFQLGLDANLLEEVVITGVSDATTQAKLPFSVTAIDNSQLLVPAVNPIAQLRGKVPGANIVAATGRPGANASVLLRGPKSINSVGRSQGPLYIVDGVVLANGPGEGAAVSGGVTDLNSLDIERIEIVRGAAASSLYGARAGNGVIQITTRSGRNAPPGVNFRFRSEAGVSDIERQIGLAQNHALVMDETNTRFCEAVTGQPLCSRTFDWNAELARINDAPGSFALTPAPIPIDPGAGISGGVLRQAFQAKRWPGQTYNAVQDVVHPRPYTQQSLDMTVKSGSTNLYASGSFQEEGGSIRFLQGYRRMSGRLNADQQITDHLSVALRTQYSRARSDGFDQDGGGPAFFRLTRQPASANILAHDALGRLYVRTNLMNGGAQNENPLQSLQNTAREDINDRFLGGLRLKYAPFEWLDVEGNFSYDYGKGTFNQFRDKGYRATTAGFAASPVQSPGAILTGAWGFNSFNTSLNVVARRTLAPDFLSRINVNYLFQREDNHFRRSSGFGLAAAGVENALNATQCGGFLGGCATSLTTSQRLMGIGGAVGLEYKERYIADGLVRRDGSSLFGSANRWATYYRGSLAWRVAQEPVWPFKDQIDEFKLRVSRGTAGGRPNFTAQYETYTLGAGGVLTPSTLGNRNLRPETTTETEAGVDLQLFRRIGVTVNYAFSQTKDQILPVPLPAATGFERQWQNAGTLDNKTWELSINVPIIQRRDVSWSIRGTYERTRTCISQLSVLPFNFGTPLQGTGSMFRAKVGCSTGEQFGTFYGRRFMSSCSQLPGAYVSACTENIGYAGGDATKSFQRNDDGYIVWVGSGNSWRDGVTKNLWQTALPGAATDFKQNVNWGMLIVQREPDGNDQFALGHALPAFRYSIAQDFRWKNVTLYALLDASIGQRVWNQGRHWSYLDFNNRDQDQRGKSVETAKPIGYYYRAAPPTSGAGVGGLYDILAPNNHFVENASYAKLREASLSYHVGPVGGWGDWDVTVLGRNLFTITGYRGFDPEVGIGDLQGLGGTGGANSAGAAAINAVDAFTFPNLRQFSIAVTTRF
jgi:TonB-linked SusC/RagA family outer membrane protein